MIELLRKGVTKLFQKVSKNSNLLWSVRMTMGVVIPSGHCALILYPLVWIFKRFCQNFCYKKSTHLDHSYLNYALACSCIVGRCVLARTVFSLGLYLCFIEKWYTSSLKSMNYLQQNGTEPILEFHFPSLAFPSAWVSIIVSVSCAEIGLFRRFPRTIQFKYIWYRSCKIKSM